MVTYRSTRAETQLSNAVSLYCDVSSKIFSLTHCGKKIRCISGGLFLMSHNFAFI